MNPFFDNIRSVCEDLKSRNHILLFALFQEEESLGRWDLIVAAEGLKEGLAAYELVFDAMRNHLTPIELGMISRIVVLPANDEGLVSFLAGSPKSTSDYEILNLDFGDSRVSRAHVFHAEGKLSRPPRFLQKSKHGD